MIWKDRVKQYPHRYTLANVSGSTYDFAEVTGSVAEEGTPVNADNLNAMEKELSQKIVKGLPQRLHTKVPLNDKFAAKTWTGLTINSGGDIWTDGTNIYYSNSADQYVLDVATSTWSVKTWTGLTSFYGEHIWTDGTNIYHSNGASQYVLDTATSTWSVKTWTGLTTFNGYDIWTDGTNIYFSHDSSSYILIPSKSIRNWGNPSTIDDLRGINVSVLTSAWAADTTYAAYPYRAEVTVTGLTANHTGIINFNDTALALGTLKDGGKTYDGGFYIYASAVPSVTVTIESYVFWEV